MAGWHYHHAGLVSCGDCSESSRLLSKSTMQHVDLYVMEMAAIQEVFWCLSLVL